MDDIKYEQDEQEIRSSEVSDDLLEAAAFESNAGVYTQLGLCTISLDCPG